MKQYYELLLLAPGNLAENETAPVWQKVKDLLSSFGANITYEESMGRKKLAYPIKHLRHGYYFLIEFEMDKDKVEEFDRKLKLNEEIMRFIIVKTKPKSREEREKEKIRRAKAEARAAGKTEAPEDKKDDKQKGKLSLDELDKKLDEILEEKL